MYDELLSVCLSKLARFISPTGDETMQTGKSVADTVEILLARTLSRPLGPDTGSSRVQVDLAAQTHQGLVRSANEDHYLVMRFGRTLETLLTSLAPDQAPVRAQELGYGLLVADGMGGAAGGEMASRLAITTLVGLMLHTPDWILSDEPQDVERVIQRLADHYRRIHELLSDQGQADPNLVGMGTTMTLAVSLGASLVIGHIGDSRAYLFRDGNLYQLTRDHTWVQALVDRGHIPAEKAARHPLRHVLIRSLGGRENNVEGDFQRVGLADGDQLLLCTDGLTNMVGDAAIASFLGGAATSNDACQALVAAALEKGGKDNVTVALARYRFFSEAAEVK
jgi:protein phosphatase